MLLELLLSPLITFHLEMEKDGTKLGDVWPLQTLCFARNYRIILPVEMERTCSPMKIQQCFRKNYRKRMRSEVYSFGYLKISSILHVLKPAVRDTLV